MRGAPGDGDAGHFFPATYAQAGWMRDLPGTIMVDRNHTAVTFRGFNDRQLNRDLAAICATVRERQPRLPDGTTLVCEMAQHQGLISER